MVKKTTEMFITINACAIGRSSDL